MSIKGGDIWGAGLSFISAFPYLGDSHRQADQGHRMARKAAKLAGKLKKLKDKAARLAAKLRGLSKWKQPVPGKGAPGRSASGKWSDGGHIPGNKKARKPRNSTGNRKLDEILEDPNKLKG